MTRPGADRQAERYLPQRVDEDPHKAGARYGAAEQEASPVDAPQGPDVPSGPFELDGVRPRRRVPQGQTPPGQTARGQTPQWQAASRQTTERQAASRQATEWQAAQWQATVQPDGWGPDGEYGAEAPDPFDEGLGFYAGGDASFPGPDPEHGGTPELFPRDGTFSSVCYGKRGPWSPLPQRAAPERRRGGGSAPRFGRGRPHRGGPSRNGARAGGPHRGRSHRGGPQYGASPAGPTGASPTGAAHAARTAAAVWRQLERAAEVPGRQGAPAAAGEKPLKAVLAVTALLVGKLLLLLLLPLLVILMLVLPFAAISFQSAPPDLNDAWLYITGRDAAAERDILACADIDGWYLNSLAVPPSDIRIETDVDWLLLYLDCAYGSAALSEPIQGFFGGDTIRAELDAILARLYRWRVEETVIPPEEEDGEETVIREVWVTTRHVRTFLDQAGAIDGDCRDRMSAMTLAGSPYPFMEALASPFSGGWYVEERWGWYADGLGGVLRRDSAVLMPLGDTAVYACAAGTVESASAGSVVVALDRGGTLRYGRLAALSASPGQRLEVGDRVGAASPAQGLALEYDPGGGSVNPVFYLPHTAAAGDIVTAAASQLGNTGGQLYWSWYGFDSHTDWCACFVSWCADQCGYIDAGTVPKFAGCGLGARWFRARGLWQDGDCTPSPGHIIFFDWDAGSDGLVDHVGIVERVENGRVYTIEGNSGDRCLTCSYPVGDPRILGYGTPEY